MKRNHKSEGFEEFWRIDTQLWSYPRIMLGIMFIFPWRLIGMIISVTIYLLLVQLITIGHDFNKPFSKIRRIAFTLTNKIYPRLALFMAGYIKINSKCLDDYDYTKWLGEGYEKPKYYASSISNHSAWTDLFIMLIRSGGVSFVSKAAIKKVFLFGKVGMALNTIFFDRVGSKEEKDKIVEEISSRQKAIYENKGEGVNLHIFPEGATTNNTHLIPFKKGVFSALLPVRPIVVKYSSSYFNPAHDVMPMHIHFVILLSQIVNHIEVTQLPVFAPNEYLFKTHMKTGEEKWQVYAEAVRQCMSDASGLPKSETTLQKKIECKTLLLGDKYKAD